MKEFDKVKNEFKTWTNSFSAGQFRMTPLYAVDAWPPPPLDVKSSELVNEFLKHHPEREPFHGELLEYGKFARPNGVYFMNSEFWNGISKVGQTG